MKTLLAILVFILSNIKTMASDHFFLGKTIDELRSLHTQDDIINLSASELSFQSDINGVKCIISYYIERGLSESVLCIMDHDGLKFLVALKEFATVLDIVLKNRVITETRLKLNGIQILGNQQTDEPLNYIRITGKWSTGFVFSARLDGSYTERSVEKSDVSSFGVMITRESLPSSAPL